MTSNPAIAALIAKIKTLSSQADSQLGAKKTFQAFLMPGLSISPRDLEFALEPTESNLTRDEALNMAANYARLVNRIPHFSHCWSSTGGLLWNEYETILTQAIVASSEPIPEEIEKFEKARNFLYQRQEITDLLGTRTAIVDSPFLSTYKQYQEAYLQAEFEYNTLQQTALDSTDPQVVQEWQLNKSIYQRRVDTARKNWITKGYKNEVDKAFAFINQIGRRNPQLLWTKWREEFELFKLTDPENQDFYLTYFSPTHFYQPGAEQQWQQITLNFSEGEIPSSGETDTSKELLSGNGSSTAEQQADLLLSSLTVDLIQVQIMRPWMNPSIFESRFWTWPDEREPLSNGKEPPQGTLPAYAISIVVARNLNMELMPNSEQNAAVVQDIEAGNSVSWGPFFLKRATLSGSNSIQSAGMQIIAFVCQMLPKSPNPDSTLTYQRIYQRKGGYSDGQQCSNGTNG